MARADDNHLETLVRQALEQTPTSPSATDPLGTLDRRVRRARRRLAAGAGAVAAGIVAAVVIPLTVGGGGGAPGSVGVVSSPSESPSPPPPNTSALWTGNAVWATTDPSGRRWMLYDDGGQKYVTELTGGTAKPIAVNDPADYIVAGDNVVWVIGGGASGPGGQGSLLTAIDMRTGIVATPLMETGALSFGAVIGDYLFVDVAGGSGDQVEAFQSNGNEIKAFDSQSVPHAGEMVVADGRIWVHSGDKLVELFLSERGIDHGVTVPWGSGQMFAPTLPRSGPGGVWAYDGSRLIGLMPKALSGCVSCAEGDRVAVPGKPNAVVETHDGLYVSVPGSGLYFYSPDALGSGETPVTASIPGVRVITMTADPTGGVDYVDDQGNLIHWTPPAR